MPSPAQLEQLAAEISAHLKSNPQDGQGWMMLARLYAASDRLPEALDAYRKAVALSPNDANLLVEFANALALSQDRELDGEPVQLIERALKLDPDQPLGLALKAIERFKQKDYPTAIALWEHTLRVLPPGNAELTAQLESNIEEARRLAAAAPAVAAPAPMQSAAAPSATRPSAATGPRAAIEGVVRLDPALAARTRPEDTVFVYARAVEGPRMPLALIKARVRDLPLAFRLDETMAMMPSTSLAQYPEVRLEARISRSGEALPQSGDLEGSLSPVRVGARGVRIDISRALP
jgi:cytochrome c-type biogenesis protein CcmH